MYSAYILLLLVGGTIGHPKRVFVKLANGRTSRPILVQPFKHDHEHHGTTISIDKSMLPIPEALIQGHLNKTENKHTNGNDIIEEGSSLPNIVNNLPEYLPRVNSGIATENSDVYSKDQRVGRGVEANLELTEIITSFPTTTKTTTTETTQTTKIPSVPPTTTKPTQALPDSISTASTALPCHESCLAALSATKLYSNGNLVLSQGSDLTLTCELPLNTTIYTDNLIWLFHPYNSPQGQCSLTTQEYIPSCHGFQSITNTDDRNDTFLRETITLSNLQTNHTGQYMCQVELTCCLSSNEHIMNQERILHITVWMSNYALDLAIAGSVTIGLLLLVLAVNCFLFQRHHDDYITVEDQIKEIRPSTVLHMPLIDDQDTDSFDSNFDEQD
nr:uncharacterized protein LOC123772445 [Procambarus clarkii]